MIILGVKEKIKLALEEVIKNDFYLLEVDASERSLTHRLAVYLEKHFSDYHIDCEYNRENTNPKRIRNSVKTVYPDIVIHKRGTSTNLVAIEAKKTKNADKSGILDKGKLMSYKEKFAYKYIFFIKFPVGKNALNFDNIDSLVDEVKYDRSKHTTNTN